MIDLTTGTYWFSVRGRKYTFTISYREKKRGQIPKNLPIIYFDKAPFLNCVYKKGIVGDVHFAIALACGCLALFMLLTAIEFINA